MMGKLVAIAALSTLASACASTGTVYTPRPFPTPDSGRTGTSPAAPPEVGAVESPPRTGRGIPRPAEGYALSSTALSLRGAPYRFGGSDPQGFDCSGFVAYVFDRHGVAVPREVRDQFKVGKKVSRDRLEPGDLVFFSTVAPGATHVGIAIGGDQFVHAPSERGVVRVEQLTTKYWASRFVGAKRVE